MTAAKTPRLLGDARNIEQGLRFVGAPVAATRSIVQHVIRMNGYDMERLEWYVPPASPEVVVNFGGRNLLWFNRSYVHISPLVSVVPDGTTEVDQIGKEGLRRLAYDLGTFR